MSLIYPNHIQLLKPRRLIRTQRSQILEPQGSVWALTFSGNAYVQISDSPSLDSASGANQPRTWGVWLKTTETANTVIMEKGNNQTFGMQTDYVAPLGRIFTFIKPGEPVSRTSVPVNDNIWHLIVGKYDGNDLVKCYRDGILDDTQSRGAAPVTNNNLVYIGSRGGVTPFGGQIFGTFIYNRDLIIEEILRIYENPQLELDKRGLVGWWRFQEGFGFANGTQIRDWSGQENHGTMQGFSSNPWVNIGVR